MHSCKRIGATRVRLVVSISIAVVLLAGACSSGGDDGEVQATRSTALLSPSAEGEPGAGPDAEAASIPGGTAGTKAKSSGDKGVSSGPAAAKSASGGEIFIGAHVGQDLNTAIKAVGGTGTVPDEKAVVQAVVAYINAHGGMGGRKVRSVFHSTNIAVGTFESQAQEACATFTEDNRVTAVVNSPSGIAASNLFVSCLAGKNTALVDYGIGAPYDETDFRRFGPFLYQPGHMTSQRWAPVWVNGLVGAKYFDPGFKVGIVRPNSAPYQRAAAAVRAALGKHGIAVTKEVETDQAHSLSDFGKLAPQMSSAILQMRSAGVTHILLIDSVTSFLLPTEAENQGYRPRYGIGSMDFPNSMNGFSPPEQLASSVLVGWQPPWDVGSAADKRTDPLHLLCMDIVQKAGIENAANRVYVEAHCDGLFFLKAAFDHGVAPTAAGLQDGAERLGSSYTSAFTSATYIGRGRHDGAAATRSGVYDVAKDYFVYTSAEQPTG